EIDPTCKGTARVIDRDHLVITRSDRRRLFPRYPAVGRPIDDDAARRARDGREDGGSGSTKGHLRVPAPPRRRLGKDDGPPGVSPIPAHVAPIFLPALRDPAAHADAAKDLLGVERVDGNVRLAEIAAPVVVDQDVGADPDLPRTGRWLRGPLD